jgi:hypothetical protein
MRRVRPSTAEKCPAGSRLSNADSSSSARHLLHVPILTLAQAYDANAIVSNQLPQAFNQARNEQGIQRNAITLLAINATLIYRYVSI